MTLGTASAGGEDATALSVDTACTDSLRSIADPPSETTEEDTPRDDTLQTLRSMFRESVAILVPTDISSFLWMSSQMITMMFVGSRLGTDALAQYSVGIMVFNVCGVSILSGVGSAIDTIASQAYGRDPQSPEIGEVLQRAVCICTALLLPLTLLFECVIAPLQVTVFGPELGVGAAAFLHWSPLYLFFVLIGAAIRRVMFATRAANLVAYANAAAFVASPVACMLFVDYGVGLGATLCLASISFCNTLTYVVLCYCHPKMSCLRAAHWPLSPAVLSWVEMKRFLALGIPSMIAMCAEWWAFDMQEVFTTYVSSNAVAAFGICMSILIGLFSIASGVSICCTTLVGNALGANCPNRARQYVRFLLCVSLALSTTTSTLLDLFARSIVGLYTDDAAVTDIALDTVPILMLCHIGDSMQFALQGFYRGVGEPARAAVAVLITLWLVGLPSAGFFCLYCGFGTKGVFMGLLAGFVFEIPLLAYWMSRWDWNALAVKASASQCGSGDLVVGEDGAAKPAVVAVFADGSHFQEILQDEDDELADKDALDCSPKTDDETTLLV